MRRKTLPISVLAVICVVVLCGALLSGCNDIADIYKIESTDYGLFANYHYADGSDSSNFSLRGEEGEWVEISWDAPVTFNTLLIQESGSHVTQFEISVGNSTVPVYRQDEIGSLRLVYLGTVNTSSFRIKVTGSDGQFRLTDLGIYNVPRNRDFTVTDVCFVDPDSSDYISADSDTAYLSQATDVILAGDDFTYDKDGNIAVDTARLSAAVSGLRSLNPRVSVHVMLYASSDEDSSEVETRNAAMGDNRVEFGKSIVEILSQSGASGVVFDFTGKDDFFAHGKYNDFIEFVRGLVPSPRKLGVYVNSDSSIFNDASKHYIDTFYVVAHNDDPSSSDFASFRYVCDVFENIRSHNIPAAKVQITIPLYGKYADPETETALTYPYGGGDVVLAMGQYGNTTEIDGKTFAFNGYTLVKDKAAFAYGYGMQGVMLVDYDGDAIGETLSLHNAVSAAIS